MGVEFRVQIEFQGYLLLNAFKGASSAAFSQTCEIVANILRKFIPQNNIIRNFRESFMVSHFVGRRKDLPIMLLAWIEHASAEL